MSPASPSGAPPLPLNFFPHAQSSNTVTNTVLDSRPLPPVPASSLPFTATLSSFNTVPSSPTFGQEDFVKRPRQDTLRVLSHFTPWARAMKPSSFLTALQSPPVLAALLAHLDWAEAYPLFCACKAFRDIFLTSSPLRDAVLARYVPGYALSLRARDMHHYQDVQVSLRDLDLLLMSLRVPLHRYPTHALRILTSLYPTFEDDETTAKLVAFTQAHSRFVLLLQSLVHSSSAPFPPEPEEIKLKSRFSPVNHLREVTFPAPLFYSELPPPPPPAPVSSPSSAKGTKPSSKRAKSKHKHSRSLDIPRTESGGLGSKIDSLGPRRPSATNLSSLVPLPNSANHLSASPTFRKSRRFSIFSANATSPPPPQEPQALRVYSNTWRRKHGQAASEVDENGHAHSKYEIGLGLGRPTRRFASVDASTSDSSLSGSGPPSIAGRDSPLSSPSLTHASQSPHDLMQATLRTRAPILHVFVPCTKLEDGDESLVQCEKQLEEAGLWRHLSTGDVVCNLGYVPPSAEDQSEGEDPSPISLALENPSSLRPRSSYRSPPSSNSSGSGSAPASPPTSTGQRKWLIFNGHFLVPYSPPDLLPLEQPLVLPSPFYYAHITPPQAANMTFSISRFPACDDVPQMTLVHTTSKVPSPHSPKGVALAKHYAWVARVVRIPPAPQESVQKEDEMGKGWYGEWVLEYEGTKEGQQLLRNALAGQPVGNRIWELVREKSGGGRIWLRLLPL